MFLRLATLIFPVAFIEKLKAIRPLFFRPYRNSVYLKLSPRIANCNHFEFSIFPQWSANYKKKNRSELLLLSNNNVKPSGYVEKV